MPKSKPSLSMTVDFASLSKAAKKAKSSNTSQSSVSLNPSPIPTVSEEGSPMAPSMKKSPATKKSPEEAAVEKFEAALKKAVNHVKSQINVDLIRAIMRDRVRAELAAEYGTRMPAAELDKWAASGARNVAFEISQITVIPEALQHTPVTNMTLGAKHYTAEPPSDLDDMDFDD